MTFRHTVRALVLLALVGCSNPPPAPAPTADAGPTAGVDGVLATVNGRAIREEDVRYALSKSGVDEPTDEQKRGVVETLVRKELVAQRAESLGLDKDPRYLERVRLAQAQPDAIRRDEMGDRFYVKEIVNKAQVTEEEARAYYDSHTDEIGYEYHVKQILRRDRKEAEQMRAELNSGASFDDVAGRRFEGTPQAEKTPWDLGWLKWSQMPETWHKEVLALEPGRYTDVISSAGRYWIVQLVEKRPFEVTFETMRPILLEQLKAQKVDASKAELEKSLRKEATVVYAPGLTEKAK